MVNQNDQLIIFHCSACSWFRRCASGPLEELSYKKKYAQMAGDPMNKFWSGWAQCIIVSSFIFRFHCLFPIIWWIVGPGTIVMLFIIVKINEQLVFLKLVPLYLSWQNTALQPSIVYLHFFFFLISIRISHFTFQSSSASLKWSNSAMKLRSDNCWTQFFEFKLSPLS